MARHGHELTGERERAGRRRGPQLRGQRPAAPRGPVRRDLGPARRRRRRQRARRAPCGPATRCSATPGRVVGAADAMHGTFLGPSFDRRRDRRLARRSRAARSPRIADPDRAGRPGRRAARRRRGRRRCSRAAWSSAPGPSATGRSSPTPRPRASSGRSTSGQEPRGVPAVRPGRARRAGRRVVRPRRRRRPTCSSCPGPVRAPPVDADGRATPPGRTTLTTWRRRQVRSHDPRPSPTSTARPGCRPSTPTQAPAFHRILAAFDGRTGCPVLVNTSFNVRGEPIVAHPRGRLPLLHDHRHRLAGARGLPAGRRPTSRPGPARSSRSSSTRGAAAAASSRPPGAQNENVFSFRPTVAAMGDLGFWRLAEADPERLALVGPDGTERTAGDLLDRGQPGRQRPSGPRPGGRRHRRRAAAQLDRADRAVPRAPCRSGSTSRRSTSTSSGPRWRTSSPTATPRCSWPTSASPRSPRTPSTRPASRPRRRFAVGAIDGFRPLAELYRRPADHRARGPHHRRGDALHVGHHRPPQGREARPVRDRPERHGRAHGLPAEPLRHRAPRRPRPPHRLAALPHGRADVDGQRPAPRPHRRAHGQVDAPRRRCG